MTEQLDIQAQTRRWLRGESSPEQAQQTVHRLLSRLLQGEGAGVSTGKDFLSRALEPSVPDDYAEQVFAAVDNAKQTWAYLRKQRSKAQPILSELLEADQPLVDKDRMAQEICPWTLVHGLVVDYWEAEHPDPSQAVELAQLGVRLASELDEERYGAARVHDLRALAFAKLGNTLRIQTEFRRAEAAFTQAYGQLEVGTGDPLVEARLHCAEASLHGIQERFNEAFHLLTKAEATAQRFRDHHLLGKVLISRAHFKSNAGDTDEALRLLHRGLRFIDPKQEPRPVLVAWHNLILTFIYQGRYHKAAERLPYIRSLHKKFGNRHDRLRLRWVESRINLARGDEQRAEASLEGIREEFIESGMGFDAALVSLDLAYVYARQGRGEDMRRLAQEMIPIFESRDMHREAIAALLVFKKATEMDQVSVHLVEDLTAFLRRSRGNPKLRFRPPS